MMCDDGKMMGRIPKSVNLIKLMKEELQEVSGRRMFENQLSVENRTVKYLSTTTIEITSPSANQTLAMVIYYTEVYYL